LTIYAPLVSEYLLVLGPHNPARVARGSSRFAVCFPAREHFSASTSGAIGMVSTTKDGRAAPRRGEVRPVVVLMLVCGHVENAPTAVVELPAFSWCGRCGAIQVVAGAGLIMKPRYEPPHRSMSTRRSARNCVAGG
jgi:hypothetical protein